MMYAPPHPHHWTTWLALAVAIYGAGCVGMLLYAGMKP